MTETAHTATHIEVSDAESGQRLDNFLLRKLSGVPKTRIYRAIRKGEVRVDKGRAKPERKLSAGEVIRIPPIGSVEAPTKAEAPARWNQRIAQSLRSLDDPIAGERTYTTTIPQICFCRSFATICLGETPSGASSNSSPRYRLAVTIGRVGAA